MAWTTATLFKKDRREGELTIGIEYARDDSPELARETFVLTSPPNVSVLAKVGLDRLNAILAAEQALALGPIPLPVVKPPVPPPAPTQDQLDRQTFIAAYVTFLKMQRAVSTGIKQPNDKDVSDATAAMKAAFKPGYEALIPIAGAP